MLVLTACVETPVPVPVQFPEAPPSLLDRVPDLTPLAVTSNIQLSDMILNANENYSKYRNLSKTVMGWQEWYEQQKVIFETVK